MGKIKLEHGIEQDVEEFIRRGYFGYAGWHQREHGEDPSPEKIRDVVRAAHSTWRFPRYRIARFIGKLLN